MQKKLLTGCLSREHISGHLWTAALGRGMDCHTVGLDWCLFSGSKQGSRSSCAAIGVQKGNAELQKGSEAPSVSSQHLHTDMKDVLK